MEDETEELMYFFEEVSQSKQPYAAIDNPPLVTWEEIEAALGDVQDEHPTQFAKLVYEHWRLRRLKNGNRSLIPSLRFESGAETDDGDPYVCFRRREVRQIRKTRGRDAQSVEKLRKLRKELEDSRQLMVLVRQREITKRELLAVDRQIFEQRAKLRSVKKELPEYLRGGDEDLLINQKVCNHCKTDVWGSWLTRVAAEKKAFGDINFSTITAGDIKFALSIRRTLLYGIRSFVVSGCLS